jgi:CheY-like chemotaxis protein
MRRALKDAGIACPMLVVTDGQQAMDYLAGAGKYADRESFPVPAMILLDLKLPLVSGFEVLKWLRGQPGLADLPVVILTGSSEERDKQRARELGVSGYYVKPPDENMLREMLAGVALGA